MAGIPPSQRGRLPRSRQLWYGANLIDTPEMSADGEAEELVGEAIAGRRGEVSGEQSVSPAMQPQRHHLCLRAAASNGWYRSSRHLSPHWRESVPLEETVEEFLLSGSAGKSAIGALSVINVADMEELIEVPAADAGGTG